jgi:hypothetical protein
MIVSGPKTLFETGRPLVISAPRKWGKWLDAEKASRRRGPTR